jgi:Ras-related protein Rab-6A
MDFSSIQDWKIVLLGDTHVGKTSLIQQYILPTFDPYLEQTIAASFVSRVVETDGTNVQLSIWDTAGQERYRSLVPAYTRPRPSLFSTARTPIAGGRSRGG